MVHKKGHARMQAQCKIKWGSANSQAALRATRQKRQGHSGLEITGLLWRMFLLSQNL